MLLLDVKSAISHHLRFLTAMLTPSRYVWNEVLVPVRQRRHEPYNVPVVLAPERGESSVGDAVGTFRLQNAVFCGCSDYLRRKIF